ncbi:tripartite tricarboxylate transporter TctB family protein [Paracoccus seriniphilus]|uniref:tripartite tricarboxylate transporter TctB family protein n=1 Tax=Paracoccus seriniphilus TaxID=184748 RepID=UPI003564955C
MGLSFERLISVTMIGIGILGWLQSRNIKGFAFDALGSQAVPKLLSALLVLAGIWILLQGVIFRGQSAGTTGDTDEPPLEAGDYLRAISMFALSVAFAFLVFQMRLPLSICVLATCLIGGRLLAPRGRRNATVISAFAGLILGFGAEWIFTRFFFVDLPTLW